MMKFTRIFISEKSWNESYTMYQGDHDIPALDFCFLDRHNGGVISLQSTTYFSKNSIDPLGYKSHEARTKCK